MQKKGSYFRRFSEEEYLKGVNGHDLNLATEIGKDAQTIAKDAIAYSLNYYQGDYKPIGGSSAGAFGRTFQAGGPTGLNLYNGSVTTYLCPRCQGTLYQYMITKRCHQLAPAAPLWQQPFEEKVVKCAITLASTVGNKGKKKLNDRA